MKEINKKSHLTKCFRKRSRLSNKVCLPPKRTFKLCHGGQVVLLRLSLSTKVPNGVSEILSATSCVATVSPQRRRGVAAAMLRHRCGNAVRRHGVAAATSQRRHRDAEAAPWQFLVANISEPPLLTKACLLLVCGSQPKTYKTGLEIKADGDKVDDLK